MSERIIIPNEVMLPGVARLLSEGHSVVFLARGCSMLPFIIGDRDSVEIVSKPVPETGDIALAQIAPGRWVLHRVVKVSGVKYLLKGDGNLDRCERCTLADIAGVTDAIIRRDGTRIDCHTDRFLRRSERWRSLPRIVRRLCLAAFRRIKRVKNPIIYEN